MYSSLILSILIIPKEELNISTPPTFNSWRLHFFLSASLSKPNTVAALPPFPSPFIRFWYSYIVHHGWQFSQSVPACFHMLPHLFHTPSTSLDHKYLKSCTFFIPNSVSTHRFTWVGPSYSHSCSVFLQLTFTPLLSRAHLPPPLDFPPPAPCSHWRRQCHLQTP